MYHTEPQGRPVKSQIGLHYRLVPDLSAQRHERVHVVVVLACGVDSFLLIEKRVQLGFIEESLPSRLLTL